MSFGPGVSAATAACTACPTSEASMPTSSGFLCCQSKRSGKYDAARRLRGGAGTRGRRRALTGLRRERGTMTQGGENERKGTSQHWCYLLAKGCSIVRRTHHAGPGSCPVRALSDRRDAAAAQPPQERVTAALLLDRAAWYLDYFVDQFENVVAEENYIQDASVLLPSYLPGGRGAHAAVPVAGRHGERAASRSAVGLPAGQIARHRAPCCRFATC